VRYEIFREITPETLAEFDADQNISDFNQNNNVISMVYALMGRLSRPLATRPKMAKGKTKDEKKGCAARTPNPNREPSGNSTKPSP